MPALTGTDPRAVKRAALRRAAMQLVLGVMALHAAALAIYYLADISQSSARMQTTFTTVWTMSTAAVVALLLRRVRLIRRGR